MNPFDLSGPVFLTYFFVAGLGAAALAIFLRWRVAKPPVHQDPEAAARALDPSELAYLASGARHAIETAVVGLHHRGVVTVSGEMVLHTGKPGTRIETDGVFRGIVAAEEYTAVERYVLAHLPSTLTGLCQGAPRSHELDEVEARLRREGLLIANRFAGLIVRAPAYLWVAVGTIRLITSGSAGKPIQLLFLLQLAGGFGLWMIAPPRRTWFGDDVVAYIKGLHGLDATARRAPQQLSGHEMGLAFAAFGYAVAPVAVMTALPSYQAEQSGASASSCSAGSCGSSCSSGGCGGCGGCS